MRYFRVIVWSYLSCALFVMILNCSSLFTNYEEVINNTKNGFGEQSDYGWFGTSQFKDSLGISHFDMTSDLAWFKSEDMKNSYYFNDGIRIDGFFDHSELGTKFNIDKEDYIKLNRIGEYVLLANRLVFILVGVLVLLFINGVMKGKMFASRTIFYLQIIGMITLAIGLLSLAKNSFLMHILRNYFDIKLNIISFINGNMDVPLYVLLGVFFLILAFCLGRGRYLEKQNELTI